MAYDCNSCMMVNSLIDDFVNGQLVCTNCGVVNETHMFGMEPSFNDYERCDYPTYVDEEDLSLYDNNKNNNSNKNSKDKHLCTEFYDNISTNVIYMTDDVITNASHIFVQFCSKKITRGNIRKGIVACCIIKACTDYSYSISIKEISKIVDIDVNIINKSKKTFNKYYSSSSHQSTSNNTISFKDINNRFCNLLEFPPYIRQWLKKETTTLFDKIVYNQQSSPTVMSASLICYILKTNQIKFDKQHMSNIFDISVVTINKKIKEFTPLLSNQ